VFRKLRFQMIADKSVYYFGSDIVGETIHVWIMPSHANKGAWWQARPAVAIGFMLPGTSPCRGSGDFRSVTARTAVPHHTRTHLSLARMLISAITAIAPRAHDRRRCHSQVLYGEWGKRGGVAASGGCVADEASGRAPPRSTASE
jgi:hypothetical protein